MQALLRTVSAGQCVGLVRDRRELDVLAVKMTDGERRVRFTVNDGPYAGRTFIAKYTHGIMDATVIAEVKNGVPLSVSGVVVHAETGFGDFPVIAEDRLWDRISV